MPLGTPREYELARTAEMADVELEHGPHREYDYHAFLDGICQRAVEFDAFRQGHRWLGARITYSVAGREALVAGAAFTVSAARAMGTLLMDGFSGVGGFNRNLFEQPLKESGELSD